MSLIKRFLILMAAVFTATMWSSASLGAEGIGLKGGEGGDGGVPPRVEMPSGRENANWPLPLTFDPIHMKLVIDIPTMAEPRFNAIETLSLEPIGRARSTVRLNAKNLEIQEVTSPKHKLTYTYDNSVLTVQFDRPVPIGKQVDLVIRYSCDFGKNKGVGLTWSPGRADAGNKTAQAGQIHSQGEAQYNSMWFVCHDFPNDRLSTELIVTVEDGYQVVSNGRLIDDSLTEQGRRRWHWLQEKPHTAYLVTMVVGMFEVVRLDDPADSSDLPMAVYTIDGKGEQAREVFANTPEMIRVFERVFDEPYPWAKYDQLIVRNFKWGGMENTSATTFYQAAARGSRGSKDDLISHELAHQWFGDLITCKSWEHLWLNEGWASYSEALWQEFSSVNSPEGTPDRKAYMQVIRGFARQQIAMNHAFAPDFAPMVSNRYSNPDERFMNPDDVYSKGAVVLHMLRNRLGDEAFFKGVHQYIDRYKLDLAETSDFRRVMEEASGQSLERFFEQWMYRPGLPRLSIGFDWDAEDGALVVEIEQIQTINAKNPPFAFSLPLYVKFADGAGRYVYVDMDTAQTSARFSLAENPVQVRVDPGLSVLAQKKVVRKLDDADDP